MIRIACFIALVLSIGSSPVQAQPDPAPPDLRTAMLLEHRADFAGETPPVAPADATLDDPWLGRDKVLHATGSFLMTLSAQYVLQAKLDASRDEALPVSAGVALGLGLAKEVADSRRPVNPFFSTRDLVADAVGVALAVGLILL